MPEQMQMIAFPLHLTYLIQQSLMITMPLIPDLIAFEDCSPLLYFG
jgi:hypothetical protein